MTLSPTTRRVRHFATARRQPSRRVPICRPWCATVRILVIWIIWMIWPNALVQTQYPCSATTRNSHLDLLKVTILARRANLLGGTNWGATRAGESPQITVACRLWCRRLARHVARPICSENLRRKRRNQGKSSTRTAIRSPLKRGPRSWPCSPPLTQTPTH
jgi:hypothetical protein